MGKVYLIGAGPGDPELLTLKAAKLLAAARVVLHDSLVSREVLARVSPDATVVDVGKRCGKKLLTQEEINALLVSYAGSHETVVRLKGGDPTIFGRAGEELDALRGAGADCEVVPGVTAALSAAAAAGISLTDRRVAAQVLFTTFSRGAWASAADGGFLTPATTLVVYMPGSDYGEIKRRLVDAGLPPELPCAVVSHASGASQDIRWSTVGALWAEEKLPAPAIIIVGRVTAHRAQELGQLSLRKIETGQPNRALSVV